MEFHSYLLFENVVGCYYIRQAKEQECIFISNFGNISIKSCKFENTAHLMAVIFFCLVCNIAIFNYLKSTIIKRV